MDIEHPFVPGTRVCVDDGWGNAREAFVEKVYKTGRFTLRGNSNQQWKPFRFRGGDEESSHWRAHQTGDRWTRAHLSIWDETTDAKISAKMAEQARRARLLGLQKRVERLLVDDVTDGMLDAIEGALPTSKDVTS